MLDFIDNVTPIFPNHTPITVQLHIISHFPPPLSFPPRTALQKIKVIAFEGRIHPPKAKIVAV